MALHPGSYDQGTGREQAVSLAGFMQNNQKFKMPDFMRKLKIPGFSDQGLENFGNGMQGISSLAGAYSAFKQLGIMQDQFDLNKSSMNRNLSNQAVTVNDQLDNQAKMRAQMQGNSINSLAYGQAVADRPVVDGSAL